MLHVFVLKKEKENFNFLSFCKKLPLYFLYIPTYVKVNRQYFPEEKNFCNNCPLIKQLYRLLNFYINYSIYVTLFHLKMLSFIILFWVEMLHEQRQEGLLVTNIMNSTAVTFINNFWQNKGKIFTFHYLFCLIIVYLLQ